MCYKKIAIIKNGSGLSIGDMITTRFNKDEVKSKVEKASNTGKKK